MVKRENSMCCKPLQSLVTSQIGHPSPRHIYPLRSTLLDILQLAYTYMCLSGSIDSEYKGESTRKSRDRPSELELRKFEPHACFSAVAHIPGAPITIVIPRLHFD